MSVDPKSLRIFEALARQQEAMLLAYLHSLLHDHKLVEDVAQQTLLIAYRKIDLLDNPAAFPAWLRGIARREAFTAMRRQGREVAVEPGLLQQLDDAYRSLEERRPTESWEERLRLVEECFALLPDALKVACQLHYFEQLKAREIAERLAANLTTILKRLERARLAIRDCVQQRLTAEAVRP